MTRSRLISLAASFTIFASASVSMAAVGDSSLERAIDRGKTMYLYDRAAWVTSDDLSARLPPNRRSEVGGWVVTPFPDGLHVDYFGKDKAADLVVYAANVSGRTVSDAIVYPATAEPRLKEPALRMARALRAAWAEMGRHSDWQPCTNARFNTIILPPENDGIIRVRYPRPRQRV